MVIRITVEAIVYSLLYTAFMLVLFRIQEQNTSFTIIHLQLRRGLLKRDYNTGGVGCTCEKE